MQGAGHGRVFPALSCLLSKAPQSLCTADRSCGGGASLGRRSCWGTTLDMLLLYFATTLFVLSFKICVCELARLKLYLFCVTLALLQVPAHCWPRETGCEERCPEPGPPLPGQLARDSAPTPGDRVGGRPWSSWWTSISPAEPPGPAGILGVDF